MVERTLPKPDTRVRFPSAAPKAPDFVAGLFPRLKRESLPGGNTFPRALGISTLQPVSRSTKPPAPQQEAFYFELGWMGRGGMFLAPAGNPSSLRVGHPDVATEHTCLSPTNSLPSLWCEVGRGCASRMRTAGCSAWEDCAGTRRGNTRVRYRRQLTEGRQIGIWVPRWFRRDVGAPSRRLTVKGLIATMCARLSYTFLKRHQGARALRGRVPL